MATHRTDLPNGTTLQFTKPSANSTQQPSRPPLTKCPYAHCPHCLGWLPHGAQCRPLGPTPRARAPSQPVWPPPASLTT